MDKLYSFDIFDTLITRKTATPKGIFTIMQKEMMSNVKYCSISTYIRENFYHLRINAEEVARHTYCINGVEDITLSQIYESFIMTDEVSVTEVNLFIELELETEYNNIIPINENIEYMKQLVNKQENVILISDMYLSENQIRAVLENIDTVFNKIKIYVSSDIKKGKWTGNLYRHIINEMDVNPENWIHFGDNEHSDIKVAELIGIQAHQFKYENLLPIEENVLKLNEDDYKVQLSIGISRNARLMYGLKNIEALGASIGGIILYPYVEWIIDKSIKNGTKRLYFIARDGYVLKKIADIIINSRKLAISTKYIYGSRKAWRIPALSTKNIDLKMIFENSFEGYMKSLSDIADVLQISKRELCSYIPCAEKLVNKTLDFAMLRKITGMLQDNEEFIKFITEKLKHKRDLVIQYLKQEIDYSDDKFTFVEMSGTGFTQKCLKSLMSDFYSNKIVTYFYRLDKVNNDNQCMNYSFILNYSYMYNVVEMLSRAPHGQTAGYEIKNGKIVPIIQQSEEKALLEHGFMEYLKGVECYTHQANNNKIEFDYSTKLILKYLNYITLEPDEEVLEFIGDMPNSLTGREKSVVAYAPLLSKKELRRIFLLNNNNEDFTDYYSGSEFGYSLLRLSEIDKKRVDFYKKNHDRLYGRISRKLNDKWNQFHKQQVEFATVNDLIQKNVIIYAAGKRGKALFEKLSTSKDTNIVAWVDKNYSMYHTEDNIKNPEIIKLLDYDQVIICVLKEEIMEQIRNYLISLGVEERKIIWIP